VSKINNSALDQYGSEPFKQQQFGPAGIEGVKVEGSRFRVMNVQAKYALVAVLSPWSIG